jgi:hypothetical protein
MPPSLRVAAIAACLLAVAFAVAAPPASAAPRDTADAAAVRKATIALHGYILAQKPAIEASFRRFEDPVCVKALRGAPDRQTEALLNDYLLPVVFETLVHPLQNGMAKLVTDLNAMQLSDPVLRSGRAGWRVLAARFGQIAAPPGDLCAPLDAWRQAGYPASGRPKVTDAGLAALQRDDSRLNLVQRKLNRSGARLRELGVSKRVVGWWTGDTLLDDIDVARALG